MPQSSNRDVIHAWDAAADHLTDWSDEGDFARRYLLNPALWTILGDIRGARVLDTGCGEGCQCRLMARAGASVTGIEPAERPFDICVERGRVGPLNITYNQRDICQLDYHAQFECITLNMVLMGIPDYGPLPARVRLRWPLVA